MDDSDSGFTALFDVSISQEVFLFAKSEHRVISRLWRIHCFREGNTRTTITFLHLFMKQLKLKANIDFIGKHAKYFRNALVMASIDKYSEYEHLTNILLDSISMKEIDRGKDKTIREYEVDKYEYRERKHKD